MARADSLKRGNNIEMLVLSILKGGDYYGYQLSQLVGEYSEGIISLPEGSLYPALYRLADNGYISYEKYQVGKRLTRIYYHIKPEGIEYLDFLVSEYENLHAGIRKILERAKEGENESGREAIS